jgi:ribonuclease Z
MADYSSCDKMGDFHSNIGGQSLFWKKKLVIPGTNWEICGFSRSAFGTSFYISALNILLDAGTPTYNFRATHIFLSHTHLDHVVSLPFWVMASKKNPPDVYGPTDAEPFVKNYIASTFSLNAVSNIKPDRCLRYNPIDPGMRFEINANKTKLSIQTFRCTHSIPTVGYGFSVMRDKLKSEYQGMAGPDLKRRKIEGHTLTEEVVIKKFAYICDSTIAVLDNNPDLLDYKVIFIECTFLHEHELELSKKKNHVHWDHLKPYVQKYSDITFILFHFSQRYRDKEIVSFFKKNGNSFTNVIPWV